MTFEELRKKFGLDSRVGRVACKSCGKELEVPNMYGKERELLTPFCGSTVMLHIHWLLYHGWHVTNREANPPDTYFCPNCFPKGQPEYKLYHDYDPWIEQASTWMKENDGKR